ncbi:MAG: methyltransferase domain-containing protein [Anaerolineales bacterium]|nr:methyltransferase domain-containing protein [Anaerolineales bacterium]
MNLIQRFMRFFFRLLYHPFAFTYDLVADIVSFGNWKDWVYSIFPYIQGTRILELGHGPGHLQRLLRDRSLAAVAIDESKQMGRIAKRRLGPSHKLTRGLAQSLPYQSKTFDTIIATFPTEYIFNAQTLYEVRRCLSDGGRLIVLPVAFPKSGFLKWLYKITGESPAALTESIKTKSLQPFLHAGFQAEIEIVEVKSSTLLIIVAKK